MRKDITLILSEITEAETMALAQFVKRVGWTELRQNAVDDDEAYAIKDGIDKLQKALQEAGFAPR